MGYMFLNIIETLYVRLAGYTVFLIHPEFLDTDLNEEV